MNTWGIFKKDTVAETVGKIQDSKHQLDKASAESAQVEEGWDDMLKYAKEKNGPQPNGGAGKKQGTRYGGSKQKDDEKPVKEEVQQIDEIGDTPAGKTRLINYQKDASQQVDAHWDKAKNQSHLPPNKKMVNRNKGISNAAKRIHPNIKPSYYKEEVTEAELDEMIAEVLKASDDAGKWISDFVKSDAPQFAGKSKEKRKQMALAAYYSAKKNESTDYDFYASYAEYIMEEDSLVDEEDEADEKGGKKDAKEIKHDNVKDKQDDQMVMEPNSEGEQDFVDQHYVAVTDDPATDGHKTGADKVGKASEPKGQGAASYDAKSKLGFKEEKCETGSEADEIEVNPEDKSGDINSAAKQEVDGKKDGKKNFANFKMKLGMK